MKKAVQYSDKFGMIVEAGKEPEKRVAPGVMLEAAKPKVKEEAAPKTEKKASKSKDSSDDK